MDDRLTIRSLFATPIYVAALGGRGTGTLNERLERETLQLQRDDVAGLRWSRANYPGGYTSYGSVSRLQHVSPTFDALRARLDTHVARFARALNFDLRGRRLQMTDCWVNVMPRGVTHGLHLHPLSTISGTYYVRVPKGAPGLKFEDPRLERFMAAPPRRGRHAADAWVVEPAQAGRVILFESWLRHEVVANRTASRRISISFNYGWF